MALLYVTPETDGAQATIVDNAAGDNPTVTPADTAGEEAALTEKNLNDGDGDNTLDNGKNTDSSKIETTEEVPGPGDTNDATAATNQQQPQGSSWPFFIMIGAMILIMYFFMWRPEKKRRKQMEQFRQGLKKGDRVITAGGIYGSIKEVHETSVLIECESNTTLRVDKNMVVGDPSQGTAR